MRNLAISTSVRPGRVAIFVDANDKEWQTTCLRAIEYFTRMWGGFGNIIIPTDGKEIAPLFWDILERFDPDYLKAYRRTYQDVELQDPDKFEQFYQRQLASWEQHIGEKTHPVAAQQIRDDLRREGISPFGVSAELQHQLKDRLAPFYFEKYVLEAGPVTATSIPRHPHTDIVDILPYCDHPNRILRLREPAKIVPTLWWASAFGAINPRLETQLTDLSIGSVEFGGTQDEIRQLIDLAVQGYEDIQSTAFLAGGSVDELHEILRACPSRLSMVGLGYYRSSSARDWEETAVAVAGNTIQDFGLYYALSRIRPRVVWVLPSLTEDAMASHAPEPSVDERFQFVHALNRLARGDGHHPSGLTLISATLSDSELQRVAGRFREVAMMEVQSCIVGSASAQISNFPIRHFEANNASIMRSVTVPDDDVIPLFETPLPKNFQRVNPSKHRWLTELAIANYHLPRHYALGSWLMGDPYFSTKDVRVSSEGPTYFCPSNFICSGTSAELSVPRPSIRIPEPLELFRQLTIRAGFSCESSDKGVYAENACQKFGGLAEIAEFLRSRTGQLLAAAYLDTAHPTEGEHRRGVLLEERRYLDLDSLISILGKEDEAANVLDRLSLLAVLYRGLILKCQHCRRADWFGFRELTDAFTCKRCHREQIFTQQHWRYPKQPIVYYQLDELVYQGLYHNMQVPLLALDWLRRASKQSFLFVPELQYRETDRNENRSEVDLNCVVDGVLTIGEAKKENRIGDTEKNEYAVITKYLDLAKKLVARQVVFATSSEEWHANTLKNLRSVFEKQHFRLILLKHAQLYRDQHRI